MSEQFAGIDVDDTRNRTGQSNSVLTLSMGIDATAQCHRTRMGFDMDIQAKSGIGLCQGRLHSGGNPRVVNDRFQTMGVMLEVMKFHGAILSHVIRCAVRPRAGTDTQ